MIKGLLSQYQGLRREIYVLFFGRIVTNLGSMVWPMLTMILSVKLGLDAAAIAVYMTAASVIMIPANLLGGRLADRFNKKRIIVCCDCVSVLCYLIASALPVGWGCVYLMLAASIAQSMEYPAYNALFADLTCTADRARAYSLEYLGMNLGLVLSPTIAGILFKDHLPLSFFISGAAIGCSTLLIVLLVRDITPVEDTDPAAGYQAGREKTPLLSILRESPALLIYLLSAALYYAAYGQYNYLMPLDMGAAHGENGAVLFGTVSSLNCVVVVLFTPLITRLTSRLPDVKKLFSGQALVTVGYVLFLFFLGRVPVYYVSMLLFTWGEILSTVAEGPYLSNRCPASHRGRVNGFSSVLGTAVNGVVNLGVGRLYDTVGRFPAWIAVFAALSAAMALSAVLAGVDRRRYPALYKK